MNQPRHLIRPDHAEEYLGTLDHDERMRVCSQQVDRWREAMLSHPTARAKDAHAFWLETAAMFKDVGVASVLGEIMFGHEPMTPRQARRLVG